MVPGAGDHKGRPYGTRGTGVVGGLRHRGAALGAYGRALAGDHKGRPYRNAGIRRCPSAFAPPRAVGRRGWVRFALVLHRHGTCVAGQLDSTFLPGMRGSTRAGFTRENPGVGR
ncbi:MAG: hypothetical protein KatS3mg077_2825 [Candidatus Binatia bacterium]|nr:MAG: hypothetical protein KatS3mg077_2825 [Candidatus Binatia bacterium]